MASDVTPLGHLLDDLGRSGREDTVSIGDVLDAFQRRSLGVVLALFGLIALMPVIGDIPGMSIVTGTLIIAGIMQSLVGGATLWLPGFVRRRRLSRAKFDKGIEKARPWVARVDKLLKPRLTVLVAGRLQHWAIAGASALLALTFYPLAFVPFGVNAPAAGVLAFGLGLMAYDGLLVLVGYMASGVTAWVIVSFL